MPKHTTPETALIVSLHVRITAPEKAALDKLVAARGAALRAQGIQGQDTFSSWLRAVLRREAEAAGHPVEDEPHEAAPSKAQKGAKAPRRTR